jgi:hypothetical protein
MKEHQNALIPVLFILSIFKEYVFNLNMISEQLKME